MTSREYQNKLIFEKGESQGRSQGISQGLSQGEFSMALKIKEALGIDEAVRISGFSKEDLLNGKLTK